MRTRLFLTFLKIKLSLAFLEKQTLKQKRCHSAPGLQSVTNERKAQLMGCWTTEMLSISIKSH